jgi:sortase B
MAKKKRSIIRIVLIVVAAAVLLFSGIRLIQIHWENQKDAERYDSIRQEVVMEVPASNPSEQPTNSANPSPSAEPSEEEPENGVGIRVNFDALQAINPDIIGWLWIPDSDLSYPLLMGEDNQEYLRKAYDGEYSYSGSIFADYRNSRDFTDRNTLVYGHNMKSKVMFGRLKNYMQEDYLLAHPYFYILTREKTYKYEVFSSYKASSTSVGYTREFEKDADYLKFLDNLSELSRVKKETGFSVEDLIVTLSTCTNVQKDDRYIVHGKLVETITEP